MPSNAAEKTNPNRTLELQSQAGRLRALKNASNSKSLIGSKDSAYLKQTANYSRNSFAYADNYLNSEAKSKAKEERANYNDDEESDDPYSERLEEMKEEARQKVFQENKEKADEDSDMEDGDQEEGENTDKLVDQGKKAANLLIWWVKNKKVQVTTETLVTTFPENLGLPIFPLLFWWVADNTLGNKKWPMEATLLLFITAFIYFGLIALALAYIFLLIYLLVYPLDAVKYLDSSVFSWIISVFTAK